MENVRGPLARAVAGLDAREQRKVDEAMLAADGSPLKTTLGANAVLAVS
ncbi:MAG: phosphopyruvate hydratase, partial [Alphaproteobacteria bacterium]